MTAVEVSAPATGAPERAPSRRSSLGFIIAGTAIAAVAGTATVLGYSSAHGPSRLGFLLPVVVVGAGVAAALALRKFEAFVLVLVAIRAGADGARAGSLSATVVLAAGFVIAAVAWLAVQRVTAPGTRSGLLARGSMCFVVAAGLSVVTSDRPTVSLQEWTRLLSAMLMLVVLEHVFATRPRAVRRMLVAVYASLSVPAAVGALQWLTGRGLNYSDGLSRVRGTFAHPNSFAMYLAFLLVMGVALVFSVRGWQRWCLAAWLGVALALLYATETRAAWIGAVAGVIVVLGLRSRRLLVVAALGLALVALLPPVQSRFHDLDQTTRASGVPANSLVWRFEHWGEALRLADDKPVTGIGLKMVETESPDGKLPHNDYVRAYVEGGVLGAVTYLGLLGALTVTAVRALRQAKGRLGRSVSRGFAGCLVALLLISATDNLMTQSVVLWYFAVFAAAASATVTHARSSRVPLASEVSSP